MSNPRMMKGPGARGMRGGQGSRNPGKTLKRLLAYIWKDYKLHCVVVAVSIAVSSLTAVMGNLFLQKLIDDYILPFLGVKDPSFTPLLHAMMVMACIYYTKPLFHCVKSVMVVNIPGDINPCPCLNGILNKALPGTRADCRPHNQALCIPKYFYLL